MSLNVANTIIDDPMPIWHDYARRYPRTIREYDLGGRGAPNHLTADEAWRTRIINSRLTRSECEELVARAAEAGRLWHGIPDDARLLDADPAAQGEGFDKAAELYWH